MSYCVNCGVELEATRKACPLCGVAVINPVAQAVDQPMTFPNTRDEHKKINRGFWIKFNSIIAAVPIVISLISNLLHDNTVPWSVIVIAGVFILWGLGTSPFLFKRFSYVKMLLADFAAIVLGLALIQYVLPQNGLMFFLALPITLFCILFLLATILLIKKKVLKGLRIAAVFFVFAALLVVLIEALIGLYVSKTVVLSWCWFALAPCVSIAALLLLLDSNEHVKQELAKRFHF